MQQGASGRVSAISRKPGFQAWQPPIHGPGINLPIRCERSRQPGLLISCDTQVEHRCNKRSVCHQDCRTAGKTPANQDRNHADVHGISKQSVQAYGDQFVGRAPGRQGTSPGNVEIAHTPEKQQAARTSDTVASHLSFVTPGVQRENTNRNDTTHRPRQCQESDNSSTEQ